MNKNFRYYFFAWAILLAIFNIAAFVSPSEAAGYSKFDAAFWTGYIFITIAFIGQLAAAYFTFKAENKQKLFYKIPIIRISYTGLVLTLIFGTLCMIIPNLPSWIGVILCFAVLGFNVISIIKASAAADVVSGIDDKIKSQTFFIKSLTMDAENLLVRAKTEEVKAECKKVYKAARYSDPMSSDVLTAIESQITLKFNEFSVAVNDNDYEVVKTTADEVIVLIGERNRRCRVLK